MTTHSHAYPSQAILGQARQLIISLTKSKSQNQSMVLLFHQFTVVESKRKKKHQQQPTITTWNHHGIASQLEHFSDVRICFIFTSFICCCRVCVMYALWLVEVLRDFSLFI